MESTFATFSLDQVATITGLQGQLLRDWVADETVVPAVPGGRGRGNAHRFTLMQVVGIMVAVALQRTDRGCALGYVTKVVEAFGNTEEVALVKCIDEEAAHLLTIHAGQPILTKGQYEDQIDVGVLYKYVKSKTAKFENRISKFMPKLKK